MPIGTARSRGSSQRPHGAPWQACEVQQRFYRLRRRMTEVCGAVIGVARDTDIDRCLLRIGSLLRAWRRGERQQQGHETGEYAGAIMAANSHCPCNSSMTIINACAIIGHAAANMVRRARNGGAPKRCFARDTADAVWTECRFESFCCDVMLPAVGERMPKAQAESRYVVLACRVIHMTFCPCMIGGVGNGDDHAPMMKPMGSGKASVSLPPDCPRCRPYTCRRQVD